MRRTSLVLLLASAVVWFLFPGMAPTARAQEGPQPPPPFEQVYQMPAVYDVPGMDKSRSAATSFTKPSTRKQGKPI